MPCRRWTPDLCGNGAPLTSITVTGEKVTRSIQDTASSVAVLTSSDIAGKKDDASVAEAIADLPNVTYSATAGFASAPTIRGQDGEGPNSGATAFWGGTVPRVAVNVDGHYQSYYELLYSPSALWDVESIEVFRGPQTVTQGANSIAGAIIVRTKDPTFRREGAAQLQYASDNKKHASLALSGPLSDELAARLAVD